FSSLVSVGAMADVDFADLIDYLGDDPQTHSIILYLESLGNVRKFLSAARAVARTKTIIVVKAGRHEADTNALFDAAFRPARLPPRVRGGRAPARPSHPRPLPHGRDPGHPAPAARPDPGHHHQRRRPRGDGDRLPAAGRRSPRPARMCDNRRPRRRAAALPGP